MLELALLKYRAFLSYAHADLAIAKWLHTHLEGFPIDADLVGRATPRGPIPKSLWPVFRDREDFAGGHTLTDATITALDQSAALVVICSTISATRPAVNEEVRLFKSRHPERPIIPVIAEGEPPGNFPLALRYELAADGAVTDRHLTVLASDIRESGDGKLLGLAKIVAGLIGVATDDIWRRAERAERAARARVRRVYAGFAVLLMALLLGLIGWINQAHLLERYYWLTQVRPYVITEEKERGLKPLVPPFKECSDCPEMIVVPAGQFLMGSPEGQGEEQEYPQHMVTLSRPFAVGRYDVTFDEWDKCVAVGGCTNPASDSSWGRGQRPVINVSWDDAQEYVKWLSKLTGRPYRLLSEAEWEYAARAGTTTVFSFGNDELGDKLGEYAWYFKNSDDKTHPVGEKKSNPWGLFDMHGNVWQWVQDAYRPNYKGAPIDGSEWKSENANFNWVKRGGAWYYGPDQVCSACRFSSYMNPEGRSYDVGFRVARTLLAPAP